MNTFGKAGDPAASDLMKYTIDHTGPFTKHAKKTVKLGEKLDKLKGEAEGMKGDEFTDFEKVKKAEATINDIDETSDELKKSLKATVSDFGKVIGKKIELEYMPKKEEEADLEEEEKKEEKEGEG